MFFSRLQSRLHTKHVLFGILFVFVLDYFGAFTHIFELDFDGNFRYPYDGDVSESVQRLRQRLKPDVDPINTYNYSFIATSTEKCKDVEEIRLLYLVKSSLEHFRRRRAIRKSWGYEHRFSDVPIRTVFFVGTAPDQPELHTLVRKEQAKYKDVVQIDFIDSYFNNTVKTMSAFKWAIQFCSQAQFYFFSDDDMYVSTKNVLRFVRNPTNYPKYLEVQAAIKNKVHPKLLLKSEQTETVVDRKLAQVFDFELPSDAVLFSGFVFVSSPHRHKTSKWYVSLQEYPYALWPPYVTAGAFVLSKEALLRLYYTSFYTKHFRFDDIYLGLVALKAAIEPFHCDEFYFYKKEYSDMNYKYVIASHGYDDPDELEKVWNEQRSAGHA